MDDETLEPAEIDDEFNRTQPLGHAINAVASAELIVAEVEGLPPEIAARTEQFLDELI